MADETPTYGGRNVGLHPITPFLHTPNIRQAQAQEGAANVIKSEGEDWDALLTKYDMFTERTKANDAFGKMSLDAIGKLRELKEGNEGINASGLLEKGVEMYDGLSATYGVGLGRRGQEVFDDLHRRFKAQGLQALSLYEGQQVNAASITAKETSLKNIRQMLADNPDGFAFDDAMDNALAVVLGDYEDMTGKVGYGKGEEKGSWRTSSKDMMEIMEAERPLMAEEISKILNDYAKTHVEALANPSSSFAQEDRTRSLKAAARHLQIYLDDGFISQAEGRAIGGKIGNELIDQEAWKISQMVINGPRAAGRKVDILADVDALVTGAGGGTRMREKARTYAKDGVSIRDAQTETDKKELYERTMRLVESLFPSAGESRGGIATWMPPANYSELKDAAIDMQPDAAERDALKAYFKAQEEKYSGRGPGGLTDDQKSEHARWFFVTDDEKVAKYNSEHALFMDFPSLKGTEVWMDMLKDVKGARSGATEDRAFSTEAKERAKSIHLGKGKKVDARRHNYYMNAMAEHGRRSADGNVLGRTDRKQIFTDMELQGRSGKMLYQSWLDPMDSNWQGKDGRFFESIPDKEYQEIRETFKSLEVDPDKVPNSTYYTMYLRMKALRGAPEIIDLDTGEPVETEFEVSDTEISPARPERKRREGYVPTGGFWDFFHTPIMGDE